MNIKNAAFINQQGKRANNEDSVYPAKDTVNPVSNLFLVCDGVGGSAKGEVASKMACSLFAQYFAANTNKTIDAQYIAAAIQEIQTEFQQYISTNPDATGMATTLTLLYFNEENAITAHAGDSRIYQIRNGKIIFQTQDHSWVNLQIQIGKLDARSAENHPKRNQIVNALQSKSVATTTAEVHQITDLQNDDFFLLCTDGVLESFRNIDIENLFKDKKSVEEYINLINHKCGINSNDNYSAFLLQITNCKPQKTTTPINKIKTNPKSKMQPQKKESMLDFFINLIAPKK